MREHSGDLWLVAADARVITTNGFVKKNGCAVMGRGCAKEAASRWPQLPKLLGNAIDVQGNHVHDLWKPVDGPTIVTFPVKYNWWEPADIRLIQRSVVELLEKTDRLGWQNIVMPRPGCGNGRLSWGQIGPLLSDTLDDRFIVCHKEVADG